MRCGVFGYILRRAHEVPKPSVNACASQCWEHSAWGFRISPHRGTGRPPTTMPPQRTRCSGSFRGREQTQVCMGVVVPCRSSSQVWRYEDIWPCIGLSGRGKKRIRSASSTAAGVGNEGLTLVVLVLPCTRTRCGGSRAHCQHQMTTQRALHAANMRLVWRNAIMNTYKPARGSARASSERRKRHSSKGKDQARGSKVDRPPRRAADKLPNGDRLLTHWCPRGAGPLQQASYFVVTGAVFVSCAEQACHCEFSRVAPSTWSRKAEVWLFNITGRWKR